MATTKKSKKTKTTTTKKTTTRKVTQATPSAASPAKVTVNSSKAGASPLAKLAFWNKVLALLCVGQAVAVAWLSNATSSAVTTQYLTADPLASEAAGHQVLATA